jgi:hypothetical protein
MHSQTIFRAHGAFVALHRRSSALFTSLQILYNQPVSFNQSSNFDKK